VIVLAEWGDLTQLATASLAATSSTPVAVGVGALAALWAVAALAVTVGRQLVARVPLRVLHRVAAGVFAALAMLTAVELVV
jgi:putative Ca2+/H+ antiporter (TMEM165/GDT1 family)